jgi:dCMP deaminase
MTASSSTAIIAYVPVLHQGYLDFFAKNGGNGQLYLLSEEILEKFPELKKDIRRLAPEKMVMALSSLCLFKNIQILYLKDVPIILQKYQKLIMPEDELTRALAAQFSFTDKVEWQNIFLRWDKKKTLEQQAVHADKEVFSTEMNQHFFRLAQNETQKSADWWRQVAAITWKNEELIGLNHNHHVPSEQQPYFDGDPRGNFHKGEYIELSTALHAEAALIADAAKKGISLQDAKMYTTTFPCPNCAKLVAYSGIKELYFSEGYAMLDGESILKQNGVAMIRVKES